MKRVVQHLQAQLTYLEYILGFIELRAVRAVIAARTTKLTAAKRDQYIQTFSEELRVAVRKL